MITVEITQEPVHERNIKKGDREFRFREQTGWMHKPGQAYPDRLTIPLERDQVPYGPGEYDLHPNSFGPDKYGRISIVKTVLVPRLNKSVQPISKSA